MSDLKILHPFTNAPVEPVTPTNAKAHVLEAQYPGWTFSLTLEENLTLAEGTAHDGMIYTHFWKVHGMDTSASVEIRGWMLIGSGPAKNHTQSQRLARALIEEMLV